MGHFQFQSDIFILLYLLLLVIFCVLVNLSEMMIKYWIGQLMSGFLPATCGIKKQCLKNVTLFSFCCIWVIIRHNFKRKNYEDSQESFSSNILVETRCCHFTRFCSLLLTYLCNVCSIYMVFSCSIYMVFSPSYSHMEIFCTTAPQF